MISTPTLKERVSLPAIKTLTPRSGHTPSLSARSYDPGCLSPFRYPSYKIEKPAPMTPRSEKKSHRIIINSYSTPRSVTDRDLASRTKKMETYLASKGKMKDVEKRAIAEENDIRKRRILGKFIDFCSIHINQYSEKDSKLLKSDVSNREKLIKLSEKIFELYGISVSYDFSPKSDSTITIYPLPDRDQIAIFFKAIIPELCKFPFSFVKNLGLPVFKLVECVILHKSNSDPKVMKKLYQGIFPLENLADTRSKKIFFYKVILYSMKLKYPDFDIDWNVISDYFKERNEDQFDIYGLKKAPERNIYDEQAEILFELFSNPNGMDTEDKKKSAYVEFLTKIVEYTDEIAVNQSFWEYIYEIQHIQASVE